MIKPVASVGVLLMVALPVLAKSPIVDAPTSPDHPLSKSRGWVEKPAESAVATQLGHTAEAARTSHRRERSAPPFHRPQDRSLVTPENSANRLNQQELSRLTTGSGAP